MEFGTYFVYFHTFTSKIQSPTNSHRVWVACGYLPADNQSRSQTFDPFGQRRNRSPTLTKRIEALETRMVAAAADN